MTEKPLPSATTMAVNLGKSIVNATVKAATTGEVTVPEHVYDERIAVCRENVCGNFRASDTRCAACGCFIKIKARGAAEHCPENRWPGDLDDLL